MITTHPPLRKGETFIGNQDEPFLPEYLQGIEGFRFASPAYDIDGKKLGGHYALIASPSAAANYNRIMENRLSAILLG